MALMQEIKPEHTEFRQAEGDVISTKMLDIENFVNENFKMEHFEVKTEIKEEIPDNDNAELNGETVNRNLNVEFIDYNAEIKEEPVDNEEYLGTFVNDEEGKKNCISNCELKGLYLQGLGEDKKNKREYDFKIKMKERRKLTCSECGKTLCNKQSLSYHIQSMHNDLKRSRDSSAAFIIRNQLSHSQFAHERKKHNLPYKCSACDRAYRYQCALKEHIQSVHEKVKSHICPFCGIAFSWKNSLSEHILAIHRKVKPFKCKECEYSSCRSYDLSMHIQSIHKKVKKFQCSECEYSSCKEYNVTKHIQTVHLKIKPFKCTECDVSFCWKRSLTEHIQTIHRKYKPFKCSDCAYSTCRKSDLSKHIQTIHIKI